MRTSSIHLEVFKKVVLPVCRAGRALTSKQRKRFERVNQRLVDCETTEANKERGRCTSDIKNHNSDGGVADVAGNEGAEAFLTSCVP